MPYIDEAAAPFYYQDGVRSVILQMKKGKAHLHIPLAEEMAGCMERFSDAFDWITCIPQSSKSAGERGFNQAELLARRVSQLSGIPFAETLKRIKHDMAQKTLNAEERAENIKGNFIILPAKDVKGKHLLLIDDIKTTGSTANEAAKVLKEAGAARVSLLCAAFTRLTDHNIRTRSK